MTSFGRRLAAERPEEIAISDGVTALRWAEVDDLLNRTANRFRSADLGPDRRIGVFARNSTEAAVAHLAGVLAGASVVPINCHLTTPELSFILEDASVRVLLTGPETAPTASDAAARAGVEGVVVLGDDESHGIALRAWIEEASPSDPPEDVAPRPQLVYTSGTTGRPKGAELPPASFAGGRTIGQHLEQLRRTSPFAEYGTHLVVGPMYHTGPMSGLRLLLAGIPLRIMRRFDPGELLRLVESEQVETAVMVPTHFRRLLALPEGVRQNADVSSLRYVLHTGAACPVPVKQAMLDWWGPVLYEVYGATEVGPTCAIGPHGWLRHPGSVGRPVPPFEVLVRDENGNEVPPGTEGVVWFRDGSGRGIRYKGAAAEPTAASDIGDDPSVFTLGEIGYVDRDGYVFLTDRAADMVVSGGVNIYPAEAEQVIASHPFVADVSCVGVPHEDMGEEVVALVVTRSPGDVLPDEVMTWCRDRLAHYKCPRRVELVESLPRSDMGKLNKRKLRDAYLAGQVNCLPVG